MAAEAEAAREARAKVKIKRSTIVTNSYTTISTTTTTALMLSNRIETGLIFVTFDLL